MKSLSQHINESLINEAVKYQDNAEYLAFYNEITNGHKSNIPYNVISKVIPMFKKDSADEIKDFLKTYVKDAARYDELVPLVDAYFKANR